MTTIQNFDTEYCIKIRCGLLWLGSNNLHVCYGNPETCKENNKHGYPKEVKDEETKSNI